MLDHDSAVLLVLVPCFHMRVSIDFHFIDFPTVLGVLEVHIIVQESMFYCFEFSV